MLDIRPTILDVRREKYRNGQEKTGRKFSIFPLPQQASEKGESKKYDFTTLFQRECGIEVGHFFTIDKDAHQTIGKGLEHHLKCTFWSIVIFTITAGEFHAPFLGLCGNFFLRERKITDHSLRFAKTMKGKLSE